MRIDVHAHHFPSPYLDALTVAGSNDPLNALFAPGAGITLQERVGLLDDVGIDVQVLSLSGILPDLSDRRAASEAARLGNDLYAEVTSAFGGRFQAFGALPLPHVDEALAEAQRCLDELGMVGVTLGCSMGSRPLDDPAFEPLFEELDRREAVLFLHPRGVGAGPHSVEFGLEWTLGAAVEDAVAALRLMLSGSLDRHPRIKIIVPHLGGVLPFLAQRFDDAVERQRETGYLSSPMQRRPTEYLTRLWYDTVNEHVPALQCACTTYGVDRVLLGTDFPYLAGDVFRRCIPYVEAAGLGATDTTDILGGNAARLLELGAGV